MPPLGRVRTPRLLSARSSSAREVSRPPEAVTVSGPRTAAAHRPRSCVTADAARPSAARRWAAELSPDRGGSGVPARRKLQGQHAGRRLDEPVPRQVAAAHGGQHAVVRGAHVRRHQQQVVAGLEGPHRRLARRPLHRRRHVHRVADHDALEAEIAAQHVGQHLVREGRRHARVDRPDVEVAGHHQPRAGVDAGRERAQVHVVEPLAGLLEHRQLGVRVGGRAPVPREVLERRRDARALQPAHGRRRPARRRGRRRRRTTGSRSPRRRCPARRRPGRSRRSRRGRRARCRRRASRPRCRFGLSAAPIAIAPGSAVTPALIRVTVPNSWSVPTSSGGPPALSGPAALRRPSVRSRTCRTLSTLVVGWLVPVGSSAEKPTRMTPPSRYFAIISAGVSTPASLRLPAAEPALTFTASLP